MSEGRGPTSPGSGTRHTDKGRERADQILDAGFAALSQKSAHDYLPSRAETLRATGSYPGGLGMASVGSFRNLFGTVDGFHRRLVRERLLVTHPVIPETVAMLGDLAEALESGDMVNIADMVARIVRHNIEANLAGRRTEHGRMICFAAALAPGGEVAADALKEDYRHFTGEFALMYDEVLTAWGTKLRPPFDTRTMSVLLAALADGLTLRHLVDPEAVDLDAYQHTVVALLLLVVARPDDNRDIAQLIEEVFPQLMPE